MAVHRGGGQRRSAAGRNGQLFQHRPAAVADRNGIRCLDGVDSGLAMLTAALGGNGDVAAPAGGGQHIAVQLAVAGPQVIAFLHGDEVGVHGGGGDVHLAARQDVIVIGADIEMAQPTGRLIVRHQENMVGHRPLTALGGLVDGFSRQLVRLRDGEGGGAAAVQAEGRLAAQFNEAGRHLAHGRADGVPGLPPVNGIEHQGTVSPLAHSGTGRRSGLEAGDRRAVLHQRVQGSHGVVHIVPLVAGSGHIHVDLRPHGHIPQGIYMISVGLQVHRQHHLSLPDSRGGRRFHHLLHPQCQGVADGQLAVLDGADHINTGLGIAGGMPVIELIGVEVNAAGRDSGLIHAGQLTRDPNPAGRVFISEVRSDLHAGLAQHGGAILPEAHGVISRVTAAKQAIGHHDADRQAGPHVVEVAVDARHHPVALLLQLFGHGGDLALIRQHVAKGDDGRHRLVGHVGDEVLCTEVGRTAAPKHVG